MSKFDFDKLREQIKQSGEDLKQTFKGTDSQLQVVVTREANGWLQNTKKAHESHQWKQNQIEKNRKLAKDPKWLESTAAASRKKAKDPKWIESNQKAMDKKKQKGQELLAQGKIEEYRKLFGVKEKHSNKTKKIMSQKALERWEKSRKQVSALGKIYTSIYEAAEKLGVHKDTITYRIKTKPKDYFYIE